MKTRNGRPASRPGAMAALDEKGQQHVTGSVYNPSRQPHAAREPMYLEVGYLCAAFGVGGRFGCPPQEGGVRAAACRGRRRTGLRDTERHANGRVDRHADRCVQGGWRASFQPTAPPAPFNHWSFVFLNQHDERSLPNLTHPVLYRHLLGSRPTPTSSRWRCYNPAVVAFL